MLTPPIERYLTMITITNRPSTYFKPLDEVKIQLTGAPKGGELVAYDGAGRIYTRLPAKANLSIRVGGALGTHLIQLVDAKGKILASEGVAVEAQTFLEDEGGIYRDLLERLHYTMLSFGESSYVFIENKIRRFFVCWLRDHVHTLKGMKYFEGKDLYSGIDLYTKSQRKDGMIWDNLYHRLPEPNMWDVNFSYGNFIQTLEDKKYEFKRIPVEADVEYLYIEGIYYTWKATADSTWMQTRLDSAIRAMDYCMKSPLRWSKKYQLIKRGFTIDTWDFQPKCDIVRGGNHMLIDEKKTKFGIMYGDNTGYIASSRYLSEMLEVAGRKKEAKDFASRAEKMQERLDKLAWNGSFYGLFIPEGDDSHRDLGTDPTKAFSLSNSYSLNRGISHEKCVSIIKNYQALKKNLPPGSPGEWYLLYPPFPKGFSDNLWQYMNGGVSGIVAGELAHGAFDHGYEDYAVDILQRLLELSKKTGRLEAVYTGSHPKLEKPNFAPVDLGSLANIDFVGKGAPGVPGWTGEGENDLHEMPVGRQTLGEIPWQISDPAKNGRRGCIGLSFRPGYVHEVEIPIGRKAATVNFLHAASRSSSGVVGLVTLHYVDGTEHKQYIIEGKQALNWWMPSASENAPIRVAWRGKNAASPNIGVISYPLQNPKPEVAIDHMTLKASQDGAFWGILGLTLTEKTFKYPAPLASYGIPENWCAAAVVYALIEGLAGVVDKGIAFDHVKLTPRWAAAGVKKADVCIRYPASRGYVRYQYRAASGKSVKIDLTGSADTFQFRMLIPKNAKVSSLKIDGRKADFSESTVEASRYIESAIAGAGVHSVEVSYR